MGRHPEPDEIMRICESTLRAEISRINSRLDQLHVLAQSAVADEQFHTLQAFMAEKTLLESELAAIEHLPLAQKMREAQR